jgi:5-methylcytosine-specific restriction endonuclease McrA
MMFLQGGLCFFCNRTIPKEEASVEHIIPASGGGTNKPDNLVACCKTLNGLFGNMTVKEKLRAILKQNGRFVCPNRPRPLQPQAKA